MCNLDAKTIDLMLKNLKENQEELKKDYTKKIDETCEKIDKLAEKIDKVSEKIDNLSDKYVTRTEFEYCKEKVAKVEDRWNKIIWIIITAIIGAVLSLVLIHN